MNDLHAVITWLSGTVSIPRWMPLLGFTACIVVAAERLRRG